MVIKSMTRKTMSFSQLITYIAREGRTEGNPVVHNLHTDGHDLQKINNAFMQNAKHCPPRKNGIALYHEILSLAPEDKANATPEILTDLAERYLSQRAPGAMAWGRVHFDENPHIHLIISANLKNQKKKLRLSQKEFATVKRELEAYQQEKYPELSHSLVFDQAKRKEREVKEKTISEQEIQKPKEQERKKRLKRQGRGGHSQKETLHQHTLSALIASDSITAFTDHLKHHNIALYERSGRLTGIVSNNKKYRFRTLGLEEAIETAQSRWEQLPERKETIRNIVAEKARRLFLDFGFSREIMGILERRETGRAGQHPRLDAIRKILHKKRHRRDPHDRGREVF